MRVTIRYALFAGATLLLSSLSLRAQTGDQPLGIPTPPGFSPFVASSKTADSPSGKITTMIWVSKSRDGQAVIVTHSRMPGAIADSRKLFDATRDELLQTLHATIESEQRTGGNMPATRLRFHSDSAFVRAHLLIHRHSLYQLIYIGRTAEQRDLPSISGMFGSLRIAPPPVPAIPQGTSAAGSH